MAAATPQGQTAEARCANGLVLGHAYSVLSGHSVQTNNGIVRLIRLRNPWGGTEWNQDWSDNSPLWTSAIKSAVGFVKADDGIFFMAERDYMKYFEETYICYYIDNFENHGTYFNLEH